MTNSVSYQRSHEYRARMAKSTAAVWERRHDQFGHVILEPQTLLECCDCGEMVHPTLNERSDIRCSFCRVKRIARLIEARRVALRVAA